MVWLERLAVHTYWDGVVELFPSLQPPPSEVDVAAILVDSFGQQRHPERGRRRFEPVLPDLILVVHGVASRFVLRRWQPRCEPCLAPVDRPTNWALDRLLDRPAQVGPLVTGEFDALQSGTVQRGTEHRR